MESALHTLITDFNFLHDTPLRAIFLEERNSKL